MLWRHFLSLRRNTTLIMRCVAVLAVLLLAVCSTHLHLLAWARASLPSSPVSSTTATNSRSQVRTPPTPKNHRGITWRTISPKHTMSSSRSVRLCCQRVRLVARAFASSVLVNAFQSADSMPDCGHSLRCPDLHEISGVHGRFYANDAPRLPKVRGRNRRVREV